MGNEVFLSAVKKLTEQGLSIAELVETAAKLQGPGDPDFALQLYHLWLQLNAQNPHAYVAHFNLAILQTNSGDLMGAKATLERCIALKPDFFPAYINLGNVFEKLGAAGGAVTQWSLLSEKLSDVTGSAVYFKLTALKQIGRVLEMNQLSEHAESMLRQSLEINPEQPDVLQHFTALRLTQCKWPVVVPWERMPKKTLMKGIGPLSMSIYTDDPLLQLASAWSYNKYFLGYPSVDFHEKLPPAQATRPGRRRIGYVSSDLRTHAVGFIMAEIFEQHNREEFETFVYYCGIPGQDALKSRIKDSVDHWTDINDMDDETAAHKIVDDGIDILVDVNGYTRDARTRLFGMRPAPVIANWLGYPGTMATPYHHYIIADDWIIPKDHELYYSEKVMRLPCYQPNDRKRVVSSHRPTRAEAGLPEDAVVFCCFNGTQKISRFTFERWMTILKGVPDSVLWLLMSGPDVVERLRGYAKQCGVDGERLIFAEKLGNPEHLARYPLADLFLDTTPYGAHVTASDALWMGVPILTFSGRSFASRVCGSLVQAAGMPELVCADPQEYVKKAILLGRSKAELQQLRKKLAANRDTCVLFDTSSTVRHLEGLYKQMWKEFQQDQLPCPDLSNLDAYLDIGSELDQETTEMLQAKDYAGLYKEKLAKAHDYYPIPQDDRLWTAANMAAAQGNKRKNSAAGAKPASKKIRNLAEASS